MHSDLGKRVTSRCDRHASTRHGRTESRDAIGSQCHAYAIRYHGLTSRRWSSRGRRGIRTRGSSTFHPTSKQSHLHSQLQLLHPSTPTFKPNTSSQWRTSSTSPPVHSPFPSLSNHHSTKTSQSTAVSSKTARPISASALAVCPSTLYTLSSSSALTNTRHRVRPGQSRPPRGRQAGRAHLWLWRQL
jgi:hypothetical protein